MLGLAPSSVWEGLCYVKEQCYRGQPPTPPGDALPYPSGFLRIPSGLSNIFQCWGGVVPMAHSRQHTIPCWPQLIQSSTRGDGWVTSGLSAVFQGDGGGKRTRRDDWGNTSHRYKLATPSALMISWQGIAIIILVQSWLVMVKIELYPSDGGNLTIKSMAMVWNGSVLNWCDRV